MKTAEQIGEEYDLASNIHRHAMRVCAVTEPFLVCAIGDATSGWVAALLEPHTREKCWAGSRVHHSATAAQAEAQSCLPDFPDS